MTCHAIPVWHKRSSHKGRMVEKRQWKGPECNNRIKDPYERWQLHLRKERTTSRIFRMAIKLEFKKQIL
jgi:hypothetical protein